MPTWRSSVNIRCLCFAAVAAKMSENDKKVNLMHFQRLSHRKQPTTLHHKPEPFIHIFMFTLEYESEHLNHLKLGWSLLLKLPKFYMYKV